MYGCKTRQELIKKVEINTRENLTVLPNLNNGGWSRKEGGKTGRPNGTMNRYEKIANNGSPSSSLPHHSSPGLAHEQMMDYHRTRRRKKSVIDVKTFNPFRKTGRLFGSLFNEIKHRYSKYGSDIKDFYHWDCVFAFVFIFTLCIAPALCFGGILAEKTFDYFGVDEMLLATSVNGIIVSLFAGQPLTIFGPTGPFLIFEEMLFNICLLMCIDFLAFRIWVPLLFYLQRWNQKRRVFVRISPEFI
jgi:hypothetical protein